MAGEDKAATTTAATGDATTTTAATGDTKTAATTTAATTTTEAKDPTTLLDTGDTATTGADTTAGDGKTAAVTGDWAADWREKMAGGNEKALNILKRFSSPQTVANALLADRQRMSEGKLRAVLADDATPEQIVQYRKANGIPEKPEAYLEKLPDGLVIGEKDKPLVGEFAKAMHDLNAPPQYVHAALKTYYQIQAQQAERIDTENDQLAQEGRDSLVADMGAEFKGNLNAVTNLFNSMPEDARKIIQSARDAEGHMLLAHAPVFRALAQIARDLNPAGTVVSAAGGDVGKALGTEIEQIEKVMKTDINTYRRDKAMVQRYGELLAARDRMGSGGRAA